jgi:hypothetical protein
VLCCSTITNAYDIQNCLLDKYTDYASAGKSFQIDFTKIIQNNDMSLFDVSERYKNEQIYMIDKRHIAINSLILSDYKLLSTDLDLNNWLSLSEEQELYLYKNNQDYREKSDIYNKLKEKPPHKDGEKLRKLIVNKLVKRKDFKNILTNFNKKIKQLNSIKCNHVKK